MVLPAGENGDLRDFGEMPREEAADHPCPDHGDTFDRHRYPACTSSGELADRVRGIPAEASSSWFLIAIQCGAPPALTVIPISEMPGQSLRVSAMRATISSGGPTPT